MPWPGALRKPTVKNTTSARCFKNHPDWVRGHPPEEEAGLIALHFVNAKIHNEPEVTHDFAYISVFVQDLINFIKYFLCTEMDENSLEYNQLLSYLQTLALVLDDRKAAAVSSDSRYYEMLRYAKGYLKGLMTAVTVSAGLPRKNMTWKSSLRISCTLPCTSTNSLKRSNDLCPIKNWPPG